MTMNTQQGWQRLYEQQVAEISRLRKENQELHERVKELKGHVDPPDSRYPLPLLEDGS